MNLKEFYSFNIDDNNIVALSKDTMPVYDEFSAPVFGFIVNNTDSKEEAEEYLIKVFISVNNEIGDIISDKKLQLIKILKLAAKIIYTEKNRTIKLGCISMPAIVSGNL